MDQDQSVPLYDLGLSLDPANEFLFKMSKGVVCAYFY